MSKQLLMAIDPGFDSVKVIANGQHFKFPFSAIETDERRMADYGNHKNFVLYKDMSGTTWRVGQFAREMIFDNKDNGDDALTNFYTEERFSSDEFMVGLRSAIAMAINKTGLYDEQSDLDIRVIVALPHAIRTKYASTIIGQVAGKHAYFMTFDDREERPYHYAITESNVYTVSQTIAAILGETSDDNGFINEEKFQYLNNGPTLVIDGGYYTVGLVPVSRGGIVDDEKAESDTQHSMKNVNMAVSQEIQEQRPDIKHYSVEYLTSEDNGLIRYMQDGKVQTINLNALRKEKMQEICADLITYLNNKFSNLLDFRYILVTGGTGACYFDQLFEYYRNTGLMDKEHMLLTHPVIAGKELPIEFSIVAGAYKGLRGKLQ